AAVRNTAGEDAVERWKSRANARLAAGHQHLEKAMRGQASLFEQIDNRRYHDDKRGYTAHEVEKAMLLDSQARLSQSGYFEK
ncbi:hypothetical protein OJ936_11005, partial [Streptococcus anginosus]|nr:hypothetical protein [Streptococcus anginosus]